jgi:hypothetical protein
MDNASLIKKNNNNTLNILPKEMKKSKLTNIDFNDNIKIKEKCISKNNTGKQTIKQSTSPLIHNDKYLNNLFFIHNLLPPTSRTNNISTNYKKLKLSKNTFKDNEKKVKMKQYKDPVIAFFNRDFYCCEVPISKKIVDNQKILDYYLKDKENKEKYKQFLKLNKMPFDNRHMNKSLNLRNEKKYDIKQSLMLNDFRLYNRIHKVVRFWNKFINYACPIFQVQKFTINSQKFHKNENGINSSMDNLNNNIRLPKLYTNSSRVFNSRSIHKNKFLKKSKSTVDSRNFGKIIF